MHVGAAEILGGDDFACCRLHQRRAAEEDGALAADDDGLVRHRRHIGAAGGAASPSPRRSAAMPSADMLAWLKKIRPKWSRSGNTSSWLRQVGAAGIDEIDAGQTVLRARSPARADASSPSADNRCRPSPWRRCTTITHSRPATRPMPVMMPAPGTSSPYMPCAASWENSRNGEPGSSSASIRRAAAACRGPDAACAPPRRRPAPRAATWARRSATSAAIAAALARNSRAARIDGRSARRIRRFP